MTISFMAIDTSHTSIFHLSTSCLICTAFELPSKAHASSLNPRSAHFPRPRHTQASQDDTLSSSTRTPASKRPRQSHPNSSPISAVFLPITAPSPIQDRIHSRPRPLHSPSYSIFFQRPLHSGPCRPLPSPRNRMLALLLTRAPPPRYSDVQRRRT